MVHHLPLIITATFSSFVFVCETHFILFSYHFRSFYVRYNVLVLMVLVCIIKIEKPLLNEYFLTFFFCFQMYELLIVVIL